MISREQALAGTAVRLLKLLAATVRVELEGPTSDPVAALPSGGSIFCFWHNRIVAVALVFRRFYPHGRAGVTVLTSPSRDGEILARVMAGLGMGAVRGSSSRRGAAALRELQRVLAAGGDVAITPDGPRGPRYFLGPGVIHLCQISGCPVFPMHVKFGGALRLKTWDSFTVPWPFSKIRVRMDRPMNLPSELSELGFEQRRSSLEKLMQDEAD